MARTVSEWIGKTDDHRAPGGVRDRIILSHPNCHICDQPIDAHGKWDLDHVKALINGGENRESNLRAVHRKCHVEKTAADVAEKAKVAAIRKKHLGITSAKQKMPTRPMPTTERASKRTPKQQVPRQWSFYQPKEETQP